MAAKGWAGFAQDARLREIKNILRQTDFAFAARCLSHVVRRQEKAPHDAGPCTSPSAARSGDHVDPRALPRRQGRLHRRRRAARIFLIGLHVRRLGFDRLLLRCHRRRGNTRNTHRNNPFLDSATGLWPGRGQRVLNRLAQSVSIAANPGSTVNRKAADPLKW